MAFDVCRMTRPSQNSSARLVPTGAKFIAVSLSDGGHADIISLGLNDHGRTNSQQLHRMQSFCTLQDDKAITIVAFIISKPACASFIAVDLSDWPPFRGSAMIMVE